MKNFFAVSVCLMSFTLYGMTISKPESRKVTPGPEKNFTGKVEVEMLSTPAEPARTSTARVTFSPGARTNWHTHPLGQTLIVTKGTGRVQAWGEPVKEVKKGDVIWTPPGQKHWHGAAPESEMSHLAIQEAKDGSPVEWMEKVTNEQYKKKPHK